MKILIFYQYYHNPDCGASGRHYQFIEALSKQHEVTVITSDVWLKKRKTRRFDWAPAGVNVIHLPVPYDNAMGSGARLKAFACYMIRAMITGLRVPRPDVIFGTSTPLTATWAAGKVAQLRRIPWIFEVRDLWPDFPIQMGAIKAPWMQKMLYKMEHRLYRRASHIIPLSPDMEAHILSLGVEKDRLTTLVNGTDLAFARQASQKKANILLASHGLAGKKIILYAGTLGRANAIPLIMETSRQLTHRDDLHFVFVGSGYFQDEIAKIARQRKNVSLFPPAPRHEVFTWFKAATLSLVTFIDLPVLQTNSPAKFFDSLATGTPVIVTNPGWTRTFVETHGCGWYVPAKEPESLVRCIERVTDDPEHLQSAGDKGMAIANKQFDRTRMATILESILRRYALPKGKQP